MSTFLPKKKKKQTGETWAGSLIPLSHWDILEAEPPQLFCGQTLKIKCPLVVLFRPEDGKLADAAKGQRSLWHCDRRCYYRDFNMIIVPKIPPPFELRM